MTYEEEKYLLRVAASEVEKRKNNSRKRRNTK